MNRQVLGNRGVHAGERFTVGDESFKAVSQLLRPDKDIEVWFSLGENHEKAYCFGLHQLQNCRS
jgi:hypothetical protein